MATPRLICELGRGGAKATSSLSVGVRKKRTLRKSVSCGTNTNTSYKGIYWARRRGSEEQNMKNVLGR